MDFLNHGSSIGFVLCLALTGCGNNHDQERPLEFDPVSDQYQQDAVNIGAVSSIPSVRDAVLLGVEQVNEAGGIHGKAFNAVALVARSASEAEAQGKALVAAGIQTLVSSFSSRSIAIQPHTKAAGVLQLSDSATSTRLTNLDDDDLLFRLVPSDIFQGRVLAELGIQQGATSAVVIINADDAYGQTLAEEFSSHFALLGGVTLAVVAIPEDKQTGFDSYLQQIYGHQPELILNAMLNPDLAANLVNEAQSFNFTGVYLVSDTIAGEPSFIDNLADLEFGDGILGTNPGFGLLESEDYQYFAQRYRAQFGREPTAFGSTSYDYSLLMALSMAHAITANQVGSPTGAMIRDSMRLMMNPPGERVSPLNLAEGLRLAEQGVDLDYSGAYSSTDFDAQGDITGPLVYHVFELSAETGSWITRQQLVIESGQ